MRGNLAKYVVGAIIGFIALVFALEGVFNSSGGGMQPSSVAGTVNGEPVTLSEFNRAYEQKLQFMKGLLGDKISDEQLKMFRVRENTFQEIAQRKLIAQDADQKGLDPSAEQIRQRIMELPYFQKDGKFDPLTYRNLLQANGMSPGSFEKMIREEILVQEWMQSVGTRVQVSEAEARDEFLASQTQRNVKYVALPATPAPKEGVAAPAELAERIAPMLKADSGSDKAINELLKPYSVEVKKTELVSRTTGYLPGLGDAPELLKEVFAKPSPIQGRAKVYNTGAQIVVALVIDAKDPDLAKFEKEKQQFLTQSRSKKERELTDQLLKKLTEKAKIQPNVAVVGSTEG